MMNKAIEECDKTNLSYSAPVLTEVGPTDGHVRQICLLSV